MTSTGPMNWTANDYRYRVPLLVMFMEICWFADHFIEPTRKDCEWAAWHYSSFGMESPLGWWTTLRDLMLAGF